MEPRSASATPASPAPNGGKETVLLVDDEDMLRTLGRTLLERYGYHVLVAEDGQEAVDVYRQEHDRIDLVLLDLTMPRLSGRDTLRELLRIDARVRVVFVSGYSAGQVPGADQEGVFGFIAKPYREEDLVHAVRAALDRAAPHAG
jgi:CheY-like chemotaxis protein